MKLDNDGSLYWPVGRLDSIKNGIFNTTTGNTDWNELLFRKFAPSQTHNVSINGGNKTTHYYMSPVTIRWEVFIIRIFLKTIV